MQPRATVAALVVREGLQCFALPPRPGSRALDLYRRYAVAALGPAKAERLLREVYTGAAPCGELRRR